MRYADSTLTIDLAAIAANYRLLQSKSQAESAAVVKANAYGLGVEQVAPVLEKSGCRFFFVATLDEAIELRKLTEQHIAVFHGIRKGQEETFQAQNVIPVLNTMEEAVLWQGKAILHIDSGMHRLGVSLQEAKILAQKKREFAYIMSHLSCADEPTHPLNQSQLQVMQEVRSFFPNTPLSLANSAGIFLDKEFHGDLLRPGCALYGINPVPTQRNLMQQVVTLTAPIIQLRHIDQEGYIGYGASAKVIPPMKIATVPIGYADGYLRCLGNRAKVSIAGKLCPVIGRVSMDLITIDVSSCENIALGDEVEIYGRDYDINAAAKDAGTIGYEILTRLGKRFNKIVRGQN